MARIAGLATNNTFQPVDNPYYNVDCDPTLDPTPLTPLDAADIAWNEATVSGYTTINGAPFCQPPQIPSTPNPSWGAEAFMDTPIVNGTAYPKVTVEPKAYRLRILNAAHDRFQNLSLFVADTLDPNTAIADDPSTPMDEAALTAASAAFCNPTGTDPLCATNTEVRMLPAVDYSLNWASFGATPWPATPQPTKILTVQEVAEILRVPPSTISRYAKSGVLQSYLIGSRRLFKETDVWAFFENQADREYVFGKEN